MVELGCGYVAAWSKSNVHRYAKDYKQRATAAAVCDL